jgi:hypothetical protein
MGDEQPILLTSTNPCITKAAGTQGVNEVKRESVETCDAFEHTDPISDQHIKDVVMFSLCGHPESECFFCIYIKAR